MTFPLFKAWCAEVLHLKDCGGGTWVFNTPEWHEHYRLKGRIARAFQPRKILEVGVRYGYSAHAFLSSCEPGIQYVGVDSDDPEHNCMGEPTCQWASDMLRRTCPKSEVTIHRFDTQKGVLATYPGEFDLVHIDAAHDYHGALKDMLTFWPACYRVMLVDDYAGTASVKDAVIEFIKQTKATLLTAESLTGEALIIR